MKILTKTLEKIFYIIFLLFAIVVLYMAKDRIPYIKGTDSQVRVQIVILVLVLASLAWIYMNAGNSGNWKRDMAGLFVVSIMIRLSVILVMGLDTNQVSDFRTAYGIAISDIPFKNHKGANFPNWGMYSIYIKLVISLFGEGYLTIIIWNAIWATISVCLIYNLCRLFECGRKKALLAALIFCVWPTYLAYTIILTPEHLNIAFLLIALNIFAYCYKCKKNIKKQCIIFALCACILGVADWFKPISVIALVAIAIIFCLELPERVKQERERGNAKVFAKRIGALGLSFIIGYVLIGQVRDGILEHCYGREINPNVSLYYMVNGLSSESQGHLWREFAKEYLDCIGENGDYASANAMAKEVLKKEVVDLRNNWQVLFKEKVRTAWQTDEYMSFVLATVNEDGKALLNTEQWYEHLMGIIYYWYMTVWLMAGITAFISIFRKEQNNRLLFFAKLLIFGMACLLLISECQARYKCVVYPYLAIAAAYGVEGTVGMISDMAKLMRIKFGKRLESKG